MIGSYGTNGKNRKLPRKRKKMLCLLKLEGYNLVYSQYIIFIYTCTPYVSIIATFQGYLSVVLKCEL